MIKGYITLKQASEISGKDVEALKKQCQTGRIRGAIKQGKTWFVPQSEIVVDDTSIGNGTLNFAVSLVESMKGDSTSNASLGVTLIIRGSFIQGELIPKREYLRHFRESMLSKVNFHGEAAKDNFPEKFQDFTNKYFDELEEKDEQGLPSFIHLRNIRSYQLGGGDKLDNSYLRVATNSVDGFMLGMLGKDND